VRFWSCVIAEILHLMEFEVRAALGPALFLDNLHDLELVVARRACAEDDLAQIGDTRSLVGRQFLPHDLLVCAEFCPITPVRCGNVSFSEW